MASDDSPIFRKIAAIVTLVSGALTAYIAYASYNLDSKIKAANQLLQEKIETRNKVKDDEQFTLQVYEKVWTALQTRDDQKHAVALALVKSLPDDNGLKVYLLELFQINVVGAPIHQEAVISKFNLDDGGVSPAAPSGGAAAEAKSIKYDVFWCEAMLSGDPKNSQAEQAARRQLAMGAADLIRVQKGVDPKRVRVRMLPDVLNRQEGRFKVSGWVIRKDPDETALANDIKTWVDPLSPPRKFEIVANPWRATPQYLSVFVCA